MNKWVLLEHKVYSAKAIDIQIKRFFKSFIIEFLFS